MSIAVTCPDCDASYKLADRYAEKRVRCKSCKARIRVPAAEPAEANQAKKSKTKAKAKTRKKVGAAVGAAKASKPAKASKSKASKSKANKPADISAKEGSQEVATRVLVSTCSAAPGGAED